MSQTARSYFKQTYTHMIKIGINGFGRIGRLALRILTEHPEFQVVHINDPAGTPEMLAHLANFDSVHGTWQHTLVAEQDGFKLNDLKIGFTSVFELDQAPWQQCDVVIEASGKFRSKESLQSYLDLGVKKVVVTAPVKQDGVANVVIGVNDDAFDWQQYPIVTAASCTTNCLAPVVKVIDEHFTIKHASMTTIHALTNTQTILDAPHKDPRRARACSLSMIPTTTGSATAITHIFPHLQGKINGHAVRVPLTNPSLTDCVFEVEQKTNTETVNQALEQASKGQLEGILGYEQRPLVSIDYRTDSRSAVIDALSTLVINETHIKLYAWYDNEWGYANRTVDLVKLVTN